jgi:hypothetical protein
MSRRIIGSIVGALAAAALVAPLAHAAGAPARVNVRAEAPGRTLVDRTLTTERGTIVKDGDSAHSCTGTSIAGALDEATAGDWDATWFDGLGYAVDAIMGVRAPADFSAYWALWVNGRTSMTGVCDTELHNGDDVLEFLCTATPDFSSCTNLPLDIATDRVRLDRLGNYVTRVHVVRLKGDGTSTPVAGATIHGVSGNPKTGTDGSARVVLRYPETKLRATHAGDVPSQSLHCSLGDGGGSCGSRDGVAPVLATRGVHDGDTFDAAHAPRTLRGIARDPSGAGVAFRLTRRVGGTCTALRPKDGRFRPCGGRRAPLVDAGDGPRWSYLLPARLGPGSYRLVVIATDDALNRRIVRLRFTVEG